MTGRRSGGAERDTGMVPRWGTCRERGVRAKRESGPIDAESDSERGASERDSEGNSESDSENDSESDSERGPERAERARRGPLAGGLAAVGAGVDADAEGEGGAALALPGRRILGFGWLYCLAVCARWRRRGWGGLPPGRRSPLLLRRDAGSTPRPSRAGTRAAGRGAGQPPGGGPPGTRRAVGVVNISVRAVGDCTGSIGEAKRRAGRQPGHSPGRPPSRNENA